MMPETQHLIPPPKDERLGLCPLFVTVPREDAVLLKVLVESYEGIGVARTQDGHFGEGRALVVLLLVEDFLDVACAAIESFRRMLDLELLAAEESLLEPLRRELLSGV